ncbi:MAG TPA: hypothetical protein VN914_13885, partial [Polyangia bacterium]|nr:hypothetical protein [Polyangia bacterium]
MLRRSWRLLVLAVICVLLPCALQVDAQAPSAVVTSKTYPGAPRSVAVLDVTMPSGQHLWIDIDLCRTFAWVDTDNVTTLSNPVNASSTMPIPDLLLQTNVVYSEQ